MTKRIEQIGAAYWVSPPEEGSYFTIEEISEILYSLKGSVSEINCMGRIDRVRSIRIGNGIADFYIDEED